jgi:DNA-binding NarL/FixJ family response regulator
VVSDVKMPGLDGIGLHREVQRRFPDLCRRFVFITGDTLSEGTARALRETGAPGVVKPFSLDDLHAALARVLEREPRTS